MLAREDAHVSSQGVGPFRTENPAYLFVSKTQIYAQAACLHPVLCTNVQTAKAAKRGREGLQGMRLMGEQEF